MGQHNLGILLADWYQISFQCTALLILGCNSTAFQHTRISTKISFQTYEENCPRLHHQNDPMLPERHQLFADLSVTCQVSLLQRKELPQSKNQHQKKDKTFRPILIAVKAILPHSWPPNWDLYAQAICQQSTLHSSTFIRCWNCCQSGLGLWYRSYIYKIYTYIPILIPRQ